MLVSEALPIYCKKFKDAGGDPDTCEGVQWSKDFLHKNPHATMIYWIRAVAAKGSISWITAHAFFLWSLLNEEEHLECIAALEKNNAHKSLLNKNILRTPLTHRETLALTSALKKFGSFKAAEILEAMHA